jgi:PadR family transcriptional regulator PadR
MIPTVNFIASSCLLRVFATRSCLLPSTTSGDKRVDLLAGARATGCPFSNVRGVTSVRSSGAALAFQMRQYRITKGGRRSPERLALQFRAYLDNQDETVYRLAPVNEPTTDVIQGTLDLLILKTLSLEPMHGFGIARRVEQISRGVFKVNPGSLLTALQRLERGGWVDAEWRQTENSRRARIYRLTRAGKKQLEVQAADWTRRASAIARLLKAES